MTNKMCRQRINLNAVCSSNNYATSKRLHREHLRDTHEKRMEVINKMNFKITNPKVTHNHLKPFVLIWGTKVYIPQNKVEATMGCGMKVYYE